MKRSSAGLASRVLDRATQPPVLTLFAVLNLVVSLTIAVNHLRSVQGVLGEDGSIVTGDFMAFYTGATFVREGDGRELYDLTSQYRFQMELAGPPNTNWQPYVNPPLLAVALAPLSALPYRYAYMGFAALTLLAFVGAILLLKPELPALTRDRLTWLTALLLTASWLPLFRVMVGGQNTMLTLLLLTGIYVAWRGGRLVLAGVFLGLLTYKPQFALLLGLVFVARGMKVALAAAGVTAGAHYVLGAVFVGPDWPLTMLRSLRGYRLIEEENVSTHFSLLPTLSHSLPEPAAWLLAGVAITAVIVVVVRFARQIEPGDADFPLLYGLVVTGGMLVSPHLQHYEVAILALPVLLCLESLLEEGRVPGVPARLLLAAGFVLYPAYRLGDTIGFQPLFLWLIAVFLWDWALLRRAGPIPVPE